MQTLLVELSGDFCDNLLGKQNTESLIMDFQEPDSLVNESERVVVEAEAQVNETVMSEVDMFGFWVEGVLLVNMS